VLGATAGRSVVRARQIVVLTGYVAVTAAATPANTITPSRPRHATIGGSQVDAAPRTWQVIAGFTQALPGGNDSTAPQSRARAPPLACLSAAILDHRS
jgi:hypothetical protein